MAHLRFFASVREATGTGRANISGATVGEVLDAARIQYGPEFARLLDGSRLWLNGEQTDFQASVTDDDELAVLPPVSGGA